MHRPAGSSGNLLLRSLDGEQLGLGELVDGSSAAVSGNEIVPSGSLTE